MNQQYKKGLGVIMLLWVVNPFAQSPSLLSDSPENVPFFNVKEIVEHIRHHPNRNIDKVVLEKLRSCTDEFLIDTNIVYGPAWEEQWFPSITFGSTNYLVVWDDYRNDVFNTDIYSATVSQQGIVLDPVGISTSTAAESQRNPSVAFAGRNYLVVWQFLLNRLFLLHLSNILVRHFILCALKTTAQYLYIIFPH